MSGGASIEDGVRRAAWSVGLFAVAVLGAALAGAWAFQILGDMAPCPLCLMQRWPYYIGIPLGALIAGLARAGAPTPWLKILLAAFVLLMAWSAAMGIYHSGVEWKWWQGPTDCAAGAPPAIGAGDLLAQMRRTRVVPCDEAAWRFFGTLSLAGFNALFSAGLAILAGLALLGRSVFARPIR